MEAGLNGYMTFHIFRFKTLLAKGHLLGCKLKRVAFTYLGTRPINSQSIVIPNAAAKATI
jgi:hypothetical protein